MATILVVDDCPDQLRLAGYLLQTQGGYRCEFASSVAGALARLDAGPVDLVLTDMELSAASGLDLIDALQTIVPQLPAILMTAVGTEDLALEALKRGASCYLPKRHLRPRLVAEVDRVLDRARAAKARDGLARTRIACTEQFCLPNDRSLVPTLIKILQQSLIDFGLCSEVRRVRAGIALEEALLNAMIHGNLEVSSELRGVDDAAHVRLVKERSQTLPYCQRMVKVTASFDGNRAVFAIRDEGPGFDIAKVPDPTKPENMDRAHGRGLLLIRTFFDDVTHNPRGNEIRLVLRKDADVAALPPRQMRVTVASR
jgi:CheY-like chemotaxis protein/anti-sigma regulatory factor (Ser/Thr protein kinase)